MADGPLRNHCSDSLIDLVERKIVDPNEAYMKSVDKVGFEDMLKSRNIKLELSD